MRSARGCSVFLFVLTTLWAAFGHAQIAVSDFQDNADGWVTVANNRAPVIHEPGVIYQYDEHYGIMSFKAPSKYLGNVAAAYQGTLSFEFLTSAPHYAPSSPKIRMSGETPYGTLTLKLALSPDLTPNVFHSFKIPMDESAPWSLVGHRRAPTAEEFQMVMSNLTDLRIIGDTSAYADEMFAIRNVRLDPKEVAPTGGLKVFIMAGQSNMAGCDDVRNVDPMWTGQIDDVKMYWGNSASPGFESLQTGTSGAPCSDEAPQFYFGPEISFGSDMSIVFPEDDIVIIKFAVGGSDMFSQWTTPTREFPNGGVLWNELKFTIDAALAQLTEMGYQYDIAGFLWMQGESDCDKRYRARKYAGNLTKFIASMRIHLGQPNMPFILGRIRDAGQPHTEMVREAQVYVAGNIPNVYWFDTDDLGMLPDGIHYDEEGMIELGHRFADIVQLLP